ncbi:tetratricopeptide repeat protein [Vibrio ziniensis]|uniref:Tetratricopeptide repeat protein n=1 Tax=Vibrio ziniensis TaxID=2711221 RepID=A0A6G7CGC6_9VIBR|nr:tetratricopeptide repeat protein [Vibrio ziniensis]QIH41157.1 tetratricopeptide repeat protein [Vibrio ziniensis]
MGFIRWKHWFSLALFSCSVFSQAAPYSSPTLNEAESLIEISPQQAKDLTSEYLTARKMAEKTEQNPSTVARDETDSRLRTPASTVDAMKIFAQAEFNLGYPIAAFRLLDEAYNTTREFNLPYLQLEIQLLQIRLHWLDSNDVNAAREKLRDITQQYESIRTRELPARGIGYKIKLLRAEVASKADDVELANKLFADLKDDLELLQSDNTKIEYHIIVGSHYLNHERYNLALSELLIAYWGSIESNSSALLAKTNTLLAQLFFERRVLDKALVHLSQAADFYDNYEKSPKLAIVLKRMGDVYFDLGKYNLALVHYFNVIDHENNNNNIESVIETRLNLAATYIHLYNYPLAEQYLQRAEELLQYANIPRLKGKAALLNAGLAYYQRRSEKVILDAQQALEISQSIANQDIEQQAYRLLSQGYEQIGQYSRALEAMKHSNVLERLHQEKLNQISEDAFRQQKEFVEQTLHLVGQEKELKETKRQYSKLQKLTFTLFIVAGGLFLLVLRRSYIIQTQNEEIEELNTNLFTHSRSRLRNLRMLNAKLPKSLQRSSQNFELWSVGELIHEPLNDRLRFAMIDVPFLRNMYLQHGYTAGLELERAFGEYLKSKIDEPTRLYHFSDSNLLYIEPSIDRDSPPEDMFEKVQQWIREFQPERKLNRIIRMGIADYPFLPRAYTAINDKELLDILLMATSAARDLSMKENCSHWVYLKAIDNAPAASFASSNMRKSCKHAINQGLIKVHSSHNNEESIKKILKDG